MVGASWNRTNVPQHYQGGQINLGQSRCDSLCPDLAACRPRAIVRVRRMGTPWVWPGPNCWDGVGIFVRRSNGVSTAVPSISTCIPARPQAGKLGDPPVESGSLSARHLRGYWMTLRATYRVTVNFRSCITVSNARSSALVWVTFGFVRTVNEDFHRNSTRLQFGRAGSSSLWLVTP